MAYMLEDIEQKLVKRGKFGPLDIYPQEDKQKEDELSTDFVKSGFKYVIPELLRENEFNSISKDSHFINTPNFETDVIRVLLSVVNKKEEAVVNSQIEFNKKQQAAQKSQQTFRPSTLILITNNQKTKEAAYAWFKQLANNESLMKLSKKIPVFNKRADNLPEILITLYEYQVPLSRAVWYLKIIAYSANLNEVKKIKRQQTVDIASEWTIPLVKFMREIFFRLQYIEHYNYQQSLKPDSTTNSQANANGNPLASSNLTLESFMNVESLSMILLPVITHSYLSEHKLQCLWQFANKLIQAMLDQSLLDRQLILESMLDLLEKSANGFNSLQTHQSSQQHMNQRTNSSTNTHFYSNSKNALAFFEMSTIKLLLISITHNMHHFLQSELLSRRLAYFCCKRLAHMFNEFSQCFYDKQIKQIKQANQKSTSSNATTNTSSLAKADQSNVNNSSGAKNANESAAVSSGSSGTSTANKIVNYVFKRDLSLSSVKTVFDKFIKCPLHRNQIILLTSIVHAIELGCMQALVWNDVGDGTTESPYNGSPLDYIPCPPSRLLYTYDATGISNQTKAYVRAELEKAELCIKRRSLAIENNWSIDKLKQPTIGLNNIKILDILDALDKHCYELADVTETIEALYSKIFSAIKIFSSPKDLEELLAADGKANETTGTSYTGATGATNGKASESNKSNDEEMSESEPEIFENKKPLSEKEIIYLLCDWAITTKRCGWHRIFYVVFLIRKRQIDWISQFKQTLNSKRNSKFPSSAQVPSTNPLDIAYTETNTKKQIDEDSDNDEELISRKRKFKLNESDESDPVKTTLSAEKVVAKPEPITSSLKESDSFNRKKMKLNENNDSLDTSSIKAELTTSMSVKIEQKKKSLNALRPMNIHEKIKRRAGRQRARRAQLLRLKQQQKQQKLKEQDEKIENSLYEYLFQDILLEYLETRAPCLDEESVESRLCFSNLVSLFHMFINCKLFSHDRFVCTLISRGETFKNNLNDIKRPIQAIVESNRPPGSTMPPSNSNQQTSNQPTGTGNNMNNPMQHSQSQQNLRLKRQFNSQKSMDYTSPMSNHYSQQPASMPPYNLPPNTPLQHQKSFNNDTAYNAPASVPTPFKSQDDSQQQIAASNASFENIPRSVPPPSVRFRSSNQMNLISQRTKLHQMKPMSKLAIFVMHLPIPHSVQFQHERNQRFVVLYGFGSKRQEILDSLRSITKRLFKLFSRRASLDYRETSTLKKHINRITTANFVVSPSDQDLWHELSSEYSKLTHNDQYAIVNKLNTFILDIYKNLEQKNYLPKLQHLQFVFDLMETNVNIFNLISFCIRLLHVGPLIEQYLRMKFLDVNSSIKCFFEYLSYFYMSLIGVFRLHLLSLVLWKDLAIEVFACLLKLIRNIERPSKCSSHEKCAFMLLNEMYTNCAFIKAKFSGQFENIAYKIRTERIFTQALSLEKVNLPTEKFQMKSDEKLTSMITTSDYTIDEIEAYITNKGLYYNFVAHVFVSISNLNKEEMLRVANLCAELSNRNSLFISFWQNASKALYHRNTDLTREKTTFNELLNKINIQNARSRENFKIFLSVLTARHCLILNEFIIMVVKTCVMACPGIMADQSHNFSILEPSAWLACHILQYLYTSSPRSLIYRATTFDQRMLTASFLMTLPFNSFLLVLKGLFLLSDQKKDASANQTQSSSKKSSKGDKNNKEKDPPSNHSAENDTGNELGLDQFASNVLQEICEHDWIKERCFKAGDILLNPTQLLEPTLGRRAQTLLHIICYPRTHHLRRQNEQASTKDFIKNILQNLDIWTLRESLLEFKVRIELQKQKDSYYEYFIECLAKTTVDFLIDPEKPNVNTLSDQKMIGKSVLARSKSVNSNSKEDDAVSEMDPKSIQEAGSVGTSSSGVVDSVKSPNLDGQDMDTNNDNNNFPTDTNVNNEMDLNDMNRMYESDSIYNFDLDKIDQPESDDLELLRLHRQNQPVGVWLIAPLITKLQDNCQLKVLEHASKTLQDLGKAFWTSKNKTEKETHALKNITAWSQQPFLTLLIACLKSKDEQRPLLNSLFNGLSDFVNGKDDKILLDDPSLKQVMLETLHIRLSLVGSMFDFILKNSGDFINWAWLFVQLLAVGVVDPDNDQLTFTMIMDMLFTLIHHIITLEPNLDINKHYQAITKKISKETKDFSELPNTKAINFIRRLMPLSKASCIDTMLIDQNYQVASKTFPSSLDKRKGFKFSKKERISTWELIEGVKNASALCQSWFGYCKIDRRMLRYEYQQKLLVHHKHHNVHKELAYFKEKPEVPADLLEIGQHLVLPTPTTPPLANANASGQQCGKSKQDSKQQGDLMSMGMGNGLVNGSSVQSPSTHHLNQSNSSADIVILGASSLPPGHPSHMHSQQQQQQHQMHSYQQIHPSQNPQHSLIMNRLQSQHSGSGGGSAGPNQQMPPNMHPQQSGLGQPPVMHHPGQPQPHQQPGQPQHPVGPHQQQQQQQQLHHNQHHQQQLGPPPHLQTQHSMPAAPTGNEPQRKNSTSRQLSTPDKKNAGSAKKRNTTPRRGANAAAAAANVRGANAIAAAGNATTALPPGAQPGQLNPNQPLSAQQQKLLQQQQLMQQQQQQRSTSSPMLMPQHGPAGQAYHGPNAAYGQQPNPNQVRPGGAPPGVGPAGNHMQQQQPTHQQINQRLQANISQNQANQAQNYHPSANQPQAMNGQGNTQYPPNQMPPKALTPQPGQYPPGQMPQRQLPQPGQARPGAYGAPGGVNSGGPQQQQQPVKSTTPTLTSQLGPGQQQPVGRGQVRPLMPGQQQQQPPGVYNQPPGAQGNRMIQPQPGQPPFQNPGMNMPQQQRSGTPDAKNIRPPGPYNAQPNPNYLQQQQQQRMPYNQPAQGGPNGQQMNQSQMGWQQQQRQQQQQQQNMQRQPQFQPQPGQPQAPQQYMNKQQPGQGINANGNMMQQPQHLQPGQQNQQRMMQQGQQHQYQQNF